MHHIPSHIERTSLGLKCTGNYFADILATEGRKLSNPLDEETYLRTIREKILTATTELIEKIERSMQILLNPDGPPANADDISGNANADQDPFVQEIL